MSKVSRNDPGGTPPRQIRILSGKIKNKVGDRRVFRDKAAPVRLRQHHHAFAIPPLDHLGTGCQSRFKQFRNLRSRLRDGPGPHFESPEMYDLYNRGCWRSGQGLPLRIDDADLIAKLMMSASRRSGRHWVLCSRRQVGMNWWRPSFSPTDANVALHRSGSIGLP